VQRRKEVARQLTSEVWRKVGDWSKKRSIEETFVCRKGSQFLLDAHRRQWKVARDGDKLKALAHELLSHPTIRARAMPFDEWEGCAVSAMVSGNW
jgi:hypothetical protein